MSVTLPFSVDPVGDIAASGLLLHEEEHPQAHVSILSHPLQRSCTAIGDSLCYIKNGFYLPVEWLETPFYLCRQWHFRTPLYQADLLLPLDTPHGVALVMYTFRFAHGRKNAGAVVSLAVRGYHTTRANYPCLDHRRYNFDNLYWAPLGYDGEPYLPFQLDSDTPLSQFTIIYLRLSALGRQRLYHPDACMLQRQPGAFEVWKGLYREPYQEERHGPYRQALRQTVAASGILVTHLQNCVLEYLIHISADEHRQSKKTRYG